MSVLTLWVGTASVVKRRSHCTDINGWFVAMFLNSILFSCETWYFLTKQQIEVLESSDANYLQVVFNGHSKGNRDCYYLETGKLKVRHIIAKRRFMFLFYILKKSDSILLKKCYQSQKLKPVRNDWFLTVQNDKKIYNINLTDNQISEMSKNSYKNYIEKKINIKAYSELSESRKSKIQDMLRYNKLNKHGQLQLQKYLKTGKLSTIEKQTLFSLRSHNLNCKSNFSSAFHEDMSCRTCCDENTIEDEIHSLECPSVIDEDEKDNSIKFHHIFGSLDEQIKAVKYYIKVMNKRNLILELQQNC